MGRNFHARARLSARTRTRQNLKANQRRKCRTPGERSGKPTTSAGIAFAHLSPVLHGHTLCPALSNANRQEKTGLSSARVTRYSRHEEYKTPQSRLMPLRAAQAFSFRVRSVLHAESVERSSFSGAQGKSFLPPPYISRRSIVIPPPEH
jgi:hypothetical protein